MCYRRNHPATPVGRVGFLLQSRRVITFGGEIYLEAQSVACAGVDGSAQYRSRQAAETERFAQRNREVSSTNERSAKGNPKPP